MDRITLVFKLNVKCERAKKAPKELPQIIHDVVTTGDFVWDLRGEQVTVFAANPPVATNREIVLTKLALEQTVKIETTSLRGSVIKVGAHGEVSIDESNMSREVLRHKEFDGWVELKRVRDLFIFVVESEGPYTPESLLPEAIKVMRGKVASIRAAVEALLADSEDLGSGAAVGGRDADGDVKMNGE